jgi:hypothetical protein
MGVRALEALEPTLRRIRRVGPKTPYSQLVQIFPFRFSFFWTLLCRPAERPTDRWINLDPTHFFSPPMPKTLVQPRNALENRSPSHSPQIEIRR